MTKNSLCQTRRLPVVIRIRLQQRHLIHLNSPVNEHLAVVVVCAYNFSHRLQLRLAMASLKEDMKKSSDYIKSPEMVNEIKSSWNIGPIVRSNYRRQAYHALTSSDHDEAVLNDSKVPSCTYVQTHLNHGRYSQTIDRQTVNKTINLQQKTENELVDYLAACLNDVVIDDSMVEKNKNPTVDTDKKEIADLYAECAKLPPQWNVVQLSQLYDGHNAHATSEDVYTSDLPIKFTMFRYNRSEKRNNRPFNTALEFKEFGSKGVSFYIHLCRRTFAMLY